MQNHKTTAPTGSATRLALAIVFSLACVFVSPAEAQDKKSAEEKPKTEKKKEKSPDDEQVIPKDAAVDARVWGAVVYATNAELEKTDAKAPKGLPDLGKRLGKIKQFKDYKNFQIIGQHTQNVFSEYTNWVVPSKELFLNIDSKGPAGKDAINLHVQLWRRTKVLVKTDTTLKKGSPLVIGGPKWRDGQLIFVLLLK